VNDGVIDHPNADPACPVCRGGGWLDDGHYAMALVPCVCTGLASEDTKDKVRANYDSLG
jgi:hypothetical protein